MGWAEVRAGTRARRRVLLPLGATPPPMPTLGPDGSVVLPAPDPDTVAVDFRPLTSGEQAHAIARARADAVALGVAEPRDGNPIYDLAEMEHTLLLACVDPDSPPDAPRPFFASIEQIRNEPRLGRDRIAYLFALLQRYYDDCSPQRHTASAEDTQGALIALGVLPEQESMRFFDSLGPGLQWTYMRILASQRLTSPTFSSTPTSASGASTSASPTKLPSRPVPAPTVTAKRSPKKLPRRRSR